MKIYVGNLQYSSTEKDIREMFSTFGEVHSAQLITDKFSGESKGFGFVEMSKNSEADSAIKALNGSSVQGRAIKVNQAQAKKSRPKWRPGHY